MIADTVAGTCMMSPMNGAIASTTAAWVRCDADTVRSFISGNGLVALCDLPWTPFYILICTLFHPLMGLAVAMGAQNAFARR